MVVASFGRLPSAWLYVYELGLATLGGVLPSRLPVSGPLKLHSWVPPQYVHPMTRDWK